MAASDDRLAVVARFLEQLLRDRDEGRSIALADYQRRFPGYEDAVAEEFARVVDGGGAVLEDSPSGPAAAVADELADVLTDAQPVRGPTAARYRDQEQLARGGMGTIYRAWDPSLRRAVAMKVLGSGEPSTVRGSGSGVVERFLEEAEVTAQLEHPGIVPVHELGVDADGRVYFTMSLVRGQDFKGIIGLVHEGRDGWTQTRALGVLQRVCEAVAFAHSKDVIHRDLKPANVMVGRFGEVYVMDWGLARVGGERRSNLRAQPATAHASPHDAASGRIRSSRRDAAVSDPISPLHTIEGDIVGTPAYMAPEQAHGELERIGPRSDVYAIGAMLYHLLSGQVPYSDRGAETWQQVLAAARSGPPAPLRDHVRAVPEELLAIAETAMARDPADRYRDVAALGEDLRAFLENRVVRAHATGAIAELRKWVRRNRLAAAAVAVAMVSLLAGLMTSLWLKREADANAVRAEAGYEATLDAIKRMLTQVSGSTLKNIPGADPIRKELLTDAAELYARFVTEQGHRAEVRDRVADTFGQLGMIYSELGDVERAERSWTSAAETFEVALREQPDSEHAAQGLGWAWKMLAQVHTYAGREEEAEPLLLRAIEHLDRSLERHPGDVTLRWRRASAEEGLAYLYGFDERRDEAMEHERRAFESVAALVDAPNCTPAILRTFGGIAKNFSYLLMRADEVDEAEQVAERACVLLEELHASSPDDRELRDLLAMALVQRGLIYDVRGQAGEHMRVLDRALELYRGLARDFPLDPEHPSDVGTALHNRALLVQDEGRVEEALELTEQAIEVQRRALAIAPGHTLFTGRLANHLSSRLFILKLLGRYRQIIEDAGELPEAVSDTYRSWRHAGGMLFMAADLVEQDASLSEAERVALREAAIARGADYVRKALTLGFRDLHWFDDRMLAAVSTHPTFVALRAEAAALEAEPTTEASSSGR